MPAHPTPRPTLGPAFALWPASVVILLVFIAVAVTQLVTRMNHPAFSWPRMIWNFVAFPVLLAGVLGLVAWGIVSLINRRGGVRGFNITFSASLLILTGLRVAIMAGLVSGGARTPPTPALASSSPARAGANPPAAGPPARAPIQHPASQGAPASAAPVPPDGSPESRPHAAPVQPAQAKPAVDTAPVLDPFFAELDAECQALATDAAAAFAAVTKPASTPGELDSQIKSFAGLRVRSQTLANRLQHIVNDGITRLGALNLSGVDAHRAVLARDETFGSFERLAACQQVSMFAKAAADLFTEVKPNRTKVQVDKDGSITSTDREIDRKLFSHRVGADAGRERAEEVLKRLKGNP